MNALHGSCQNLIAFGHSDTLLGRHFGVANRGRPWLDWARIYPADFIVLSAGAHIRAQADFERMIEEVHGQMGQLPGKYMVWKTQNPGGCSANMLKKFDDHFWTDYKGYGDPSKHAWDAFMKRDKLAYDYFTNNSIPVLDVRPFFLRPDAHPGSYLGNGVNDCLHFCAAPEGPLHLIPILLHHLVVEVLKI